MILPPSYLTAPFKSLGVVVNAPPTYMRYNTELLLKFTDALQWDVKHNTTPFTLMMRANSLYDHKREIERIASTLNIVSNRNPFKLNIQGRNINMQLDALFVWGWINGREPEIKSVFMVEYINPPLKCQETADYVEMVKRLTVGTQKDENRLV